MAMVREKTWREELASLVDYNGSMSTMSLDYDYEDDVKRGNVRDTVREFAKGVGEMSVEFGKSFCEIVKQSLGDDDCFLVRKFGKPWSRVCGRLGFLNQYLPEDRDPLLSWFVIFIVSLLAFAALNINTPTEPPIGIPVVKKVQIHPSYASRVVLPDGRHLAYDERGLPADNSRFTVILPHSFLFSRLAGIPGLKASILEEFGIHLITYDLPGFGESDPHPERTLESSALDMSQLADAVGVSGKFWILGYSDGGIHVWAALRYIPERLAGVAMFAPMVNPYDPSMTKEEKAKTWEKWTPKRKLMYILARRFPRLLNYFYHRSFLSGRHGPIDKWLALSMGKKDRELIADPKFEEFWYRNVEESIRQGNAKPFVEEAMLQVSNWGFSIADIQSRKRAAIQNIFTWLKSMYNKPEEDLAGFVGPIHIWQGMDDRVVPPSMTTFVHRILPGATVHMLPNEGHFTYLYFCDECHRQMFTTLYGTPRGPLQSTPGSNQSTSIDQDGQQEEEEAAIEGSTTN